MRIIFALFLRKGLHKCILLYSRISELSFATIRTKSCGIKKTSNSHTHYGQLLVREINMLPQSQSLHVLSLCCQSCAMRI